MKPQVESYRTQYAHSLRNLNAEFSCRRDYNSPGVPGAGATWRYRDGHRSKFKVCRTL